MSKKIDLLIIDPQNDFCSPSKVGRPAKGWIDVSGKYGGALYVNGADEDSKRLADFIKRNKSVIDDIHVTLDSHHLLDVAHPLFWVNSKGEHPNPFTVISYNDVKAGTWVPFHPHYNQRMLDYTKALEDNKRYALVIWPPHCLIGSWGHNVQSDIYSALLEWETDYAQVDYVTKGSNMWTEHYSAVQAEVVDPEDPTTTLNNRLIETLQKSDIIIITGQALSHCVANTIKDIMNNFGDENIQKMHLLIDTTSNVTGFEQLGDDFVKEFIQRGGKTVESTTFLK